MTNFFQKALRVISHPGMPKVYLRWILAQLFRRNATLEVAPGVYVGNFESFSHFWNRRVPLDGQTALLLNTICSMNTHESHIIDVGANLGIVSLYLASQCSTNVISVEPDKNTFSRLLSNIRLNPKFSSRIRPLNCAVGNRIGTVSFDSSSISSEQSRIALSNEGNTKVDLTTIDRLVEEEAIEHISLLKIDVEGFEYHVLSGAKNTLGKGIVDFIFLELIPKALAEAGTSISNVESFLGEYGFESVALVEGKMIPTSLDDALSLSGVERSVLFSKNSNKP